MRTRLTQLSFRLAALGLLSLAGILVVTPNLSGRSGDSSGCEWPYVEFDAAAAPRLLVEVADDPQERSRGLMFRETLALDAGMLFIFEQPGRAAFWMKDTLVPLSIAFLAPDGTVVDIQDMEPGSLEPHAPPSDYLFALEANVGWFALHGVSPGARATLCLSGK